VVVAVRNSFGLSSRHGVGADEAQAQKSERGEFGEEMIKFG
jgi:hypothetical protein